MRLLRKARKAYGDLGRGILREARRSGQRGSLDRSEGERRAAKRPADQPEWSVKRPSALADSQRDNFVELHRRLSLEYLKTVKKL